ncbi:MAG: DUF2283 domain-containing protein [archaeon]|nr:DUF2283 domain-containing protein [archaeon]
MEKKAQIRYDSEEDILTLRKVNAVKDSINIVNINLDFDSERRIVGIEIMGAIGFFEAFELSKEDFEHIKDAKISVNYSKDWAIIKITLYMPKKSEPIVKDFTIPSLIEQQSLASA